MIEELSIPNPNIDFSIYDLGKKEMCNPMA